MKVEYKLAAWLALTVLVSLTLGVLDKARALSWGYLQEEGAYPWAVLVLCVAWLILHRKDISSSLFGEIRLQVMLFGLILVAMSIFYQAAELSIIVFRLLLFSLGTFYVSFSGASLLPAFLVGIYGFALGFPIFVERYLAESYSLLTVKMLAWTLKTLGYGFTTQGQVISLTSVARDGISIYIGAPSSGSVSMGIFIIIFALMMLDYRLPAKKAAMMFIFGVLGTAFQNLLRLAIILLVGYYLGSGAMWKTHDYVGYFLYPIWFTFFAYVYLRLR
jgi:exosortase/archaeosortase family protein